MVVHGWGHRGALVLTFGMWLHKRWENNPHPHRAALAQKARRERARQCTPLPTRLRGWRPPASAAPSVVAAPSPRAWHLDIPSAVAYAPRTVTTFTATVSRRRAAAPRRCLRLRATRRQLRSFSTNASHWAPLAAAPPAHAETTLHFALASLCVQYCHKAAPAAAPRNPPPSEARPTMALRHRVPASTRIAALHTLVSLSGGGGARNHGAVYRVLCHVSREWRQRPLGVPRAACVEALRLRVAAGKYPGLRIWRCPGCKRLNKGRETCRRCKAARPVRAGPPRPGIPFLKMYNIPTHVMPEELLRWLAQATYAVPIGIKVQHVARAVMTDLTRARDGAPPPILEEVYDAALPPRAGDARRAASVLVKFRSVADAEVAFLALAGGCRWGMEVEVLERFTDALQRNFAMHERQQQLALHAFYDAPGVRNDLMDAKAAVMTASPPPPPPVAPSYSHPFLVLHGLPAWCFGDVPGAVHMLQMRVREFLEWVAPGSGVAAAVLWVEQYALVLAATGKAGDPDELTQHARSVVVEVRHGEAALRAAATVRKGVTRLQSVGRLCRGVTVSQSALTPALRDAYRHRKHRKKRALKRGYTRARAAPGGAAASLRVAHFRGELPDGAATPFALLLHLAKIGGVHPQRVVVEEASPLAVTAYYQSPEDARHAAARINTPVHLLPDSPRP